tara:strand:+ start:307 stop:1314 length:1008 start_codon:yes stop_codon:yes gene_type:complete
MDKIKVGISIGDPNGIGVEIILSAFEDKSLFRKLIPVVFGPKKIIELNKSHFDKKIEINYVNNLKFLAENKLNVLDFDSRDFNLKFGLKSKTAGNISKESLVSATNAIKNKEVDVLVTAPINKDSIHSKDFNFTGHTDFLGANFRGDPLMFMIKGKLRIALLTDHIPLNNVASNVSVKNLNLKIQKVLKSLREDFRVQKPKVAILSLNPHSGDGGLIGDEDDSFIKPVINEFKKKNISITGPFAADSFFGSKKYKTFDAILAIYHDQGLIPFKTLSFGSGVNFTAGINIVRTSPDHGTAFDIAGKGIANSNSFRQAILESVKILKSRHNYSSYLK